MSGKPFKFGDRIRSFKYAFRGIGFLFKYEHNSWIHALIGIAAVVAGFLLKLNTLEWVSIIFCIGLVFTAELFNSSLEKTVDLITKDKHPLAKQAKDMAAGAVLIASIVSAIIGLMIFGPKLIALL